MTHRYDLFDENFDDEIAMPRDHWPLVAVGIISVVVILLMVGSHSHGDCPHITNSSARLACYDAAASPQPAKGAAIPVR